jgi:hypothetical protein
MSLRISSALAMMLAVTACGDEVSPPPPGDLVDCAIGEAVDLAQVCTLKRVAGTEGFVVHHPDGGFRRFTREPATGDIATVDGADNVVTTEDYGGVLKFQVGADRYELISEPAAASRP